MAAMSAYGKARRPRSGNEADRVSDTDAVGTGMTMSGGRMSIAFMESDKVPCVEASLASGGIECAAGSVVFRPRGDEAGSPADRTPGLVLAQGDWIELSRVSPSCG